MTGGDGNGDEEEKEKKVSVAVVVNDFTVYIVVVGIKLIYRQSWGSLLWLTILVTKRRNTMDYHNPWHNLLHNLLRTPVQLLKLQRTDLLIHNCVRRELPSACF